MPTEFTSIGVSEILFLTPEDGVAGTAAVAVEQAGGAGGVGDGRLLRHWPRFLPRSSAHRLLPCYVVAAARRADRLRSLCDQINTSANSDGPRAVAVELDVAAGGSVLEAAVQRAWDAFGRIDALINNAGIRGGVHSPLDWPEDEWDKIIKTNLTGSWLVAKHVCRRMRAAKLKGSVVNITSVAGLNRGDLPGSTGYASSKGAVNCATKIMALELGSYGIRVNSIAPGIFKSEITALLIQKRWFSNVTSKIVPLKENGTTDPALTSLVRFLIHEASSYVTGNILIADSGATIPGVPIFSSL